MDTKILPTSYGSVPRCGAPQAALAANPPPQGAWGEEAGADGVRVSCSDPQRHLVSPGTAPPPRVPLPSLGEETSRPSHTTLPSGCFLAGAPAC